jgi:hypothetical protein
MALALLLSKPRTSPQSPPLPGTPTVASSTEPITTPSECCASDGKLGCGEALCYPPGAVSAGERALSPQGGGLTCGCGDGGIRTRGLLLAKLDWAGLSPAQTTNGAGHGGRGIVRGCPLATARVRCEWHVSGTAGEDDCGGASQRRHQVDRRVRPVLGDHSPCWQMLIEHTAAAKQCSIVCRIQDLNRIVINCGPENTG